MNKIILATAMILGATAFAQEGTPAPAKKFDRKAAKLECQKENKDAKAVSKCVNEKKKAATM